MAEARRSKISENSVSNHTSGNDSSQIIEKPARRSFTAEYKMEILRKLEDCKGSRGAVGELLRCHGLYSSQVAMWKKELEGNLAGIFTKKRGPKPNPEAEAKKEAEALKKKVAKLEKKLSQAHTVIDIQKKLSMMLGIDLQDESDILNTKI